MAEKIAAKFVGARTEEGEPVEYLGGIPAVDLTEEAFAHLTDEQKAAVGSSPLYALRGDAPKQAEAAGRRVDRAESRDVTESPASPAPVEQPKG